MAHARLFRPSSQFFAPIRGARRGVLGWFSAMTRLRMERLKLSELTDAQLKDIGVSRAEANKEARRGAWDAPTHWHR